MGHFDFPASGPAPWQGPVHAYAGWIPTISGHLSFSLFGTRELGLGRCRTFNRRTSDGEGRVVGVLHRRAAADSIIPRELMRIFHPAVEQEFLLIGQTAPAKTPFFRDGALETSSDRQGVLTGLIIVIPHDTKRDNKRARRALLAAIRKLIDDETTPAEQIPPAVLNLVEAAKSATISVGSYQMSFALFRTGEFRLWFDLKQYFGSNTRAQVAAVAGTPESEAVRVFPSQAYFFVKDVSHLHYHHAPGSDQLLPLTQVKWPATAQDLELSETKWRRETLWGLARVVAQYRRRSTIPDFHKALGVLAYADAFQATLARIRRREKPEDGFEDKINLSTYDFDHMRSSIEAREGLASWKRTDRLQAQIFLAGVVLTGAALWASAVEIRPTLCPVEGTEPLTGTRLCPAFTHDMAVSVTIWVSEHPFEFVGTLWLIGSILLLWITGDRILPPGGRPLVRLAYQLGGGAAADIARFFKWARVPRGADFVGWALGMAVLGGVFAWTARAALKTVGWWPDLGVVTSLSSLF
nr:hypothetical protein [Sphingomonas sp. Y57]